MCDKSNRVLLWRYAPVETAVVRLLFFFYCEAVVRLQCVSREHSSSAKYVTYVVCSVCPVEAEINCGAVFFSFICRLGASSWTYRLCSIPVNGMQN